MEAVLEQERKASNAKDARHKLTVERLRQKLVELQVIDSVLHLHIHQQRLHLELLCELQAIALNAVVAATGPSNVTSDVSPVLRCSQICACLSPLPCTLSPPPSAAAGVVINQHGNALQTEQLVNHVALFDRYKVKGTLAGIQNKHAAYRIQT